MELLTFVVIAVLAAWIIYINVSKKNPPKHLSGRIGGGTYKQQIWRALNAIRMYYDTGMSADITQNGEAKFQPVFDYRNILIAHKLDMDRHLFKTLMEFYDDLTRKTTKDLLEPMEYFVKKRHSLFPNEINELQNKINEDRLKLLRYVEGFIRRQQSTLRS